MFFLFIGMNRFLAAWRQGKFAFLLCNNDRRCVHRVMCTSTALAEKEEQRKGKKEEEKGNGHSWRLLCVSLSLFFFSCPVHGTDGETGAALHGPVT